MDWKYLEEFLKDRLSVIRSSFEHNRGKLKGRKGEMYSYQQSTTSLSDQQRNISDISHSILGSSEKRAAQNEEWFWKQIR